MDFSGKEQPLSLLEGFISSGRIPHGIIYIGGGSGKYEIARYTAKLFVCERFGSAGYSGALPCNVCNSCLKAENNLHPDIIYVKNMMEGGKYKIDALRTVTATAATRPNEGTLKVYVFEDCDSMSELCQNTLLKFIEEPQSFNRFIFTASTASTVIDTVLSRLVSIEVPDSAVSEYDETLLKIVFDITDSLAAKKEYYAAAAFSGIRDREMLCVVLNLLSGIIRDSMVYKCGGNAFPGCYKEGAEKLAKTCGLKNLRDGEKLVLEYIKQLEQNPNLTLACAVYSSGIYSAII